MRLLLDTHVLLWVMADKVLAQYSELLIPI
jgi:PIN domain nuclease of toxin-antitoxin system